MEVIELLSVLVLSLRSVVTLFGVLFVLLVISVPSFDLLYFAFCYTGGLIIVNFLIVTGDIGAVSLMLVVFITYFVTVVRSLVVDYIYVLCILLFLLFV